LFALQEVQDTRHNEHRHDPHQPEHNRTAIVKHRGQHRLQIHASMPTAQHHRQGQRIVISVDGRSATIYIGIEEREQQRLQELQEQNRYHQQEEAIEEQQLSHYSIDGAMRTHQVSTSRVREQ
jgi:glucose/arabinose dehydrogenase